MDMRSLKLGIVAAFCTANLLWPATVEAQEGSGQVVLKRCPTWHWDPSDIPGVTYEVCFDDISSCTSANIGDRVCIPGLGEHDVWVTAIDTQGAEPVYYDSDMAAINRIRSADFDTDGIVAFADLFTLINDLGDEGVNETDLNGDRIVNLGDFFLILEAFGMCLNGAGSLYVTCGG